ncbi:MAG: hypothetical protein Q4B82_01000 [Alysiella sp.]|nr:hypothetical protein [Alysiella sp.]
MANNVTSTMYEKCIRTLERCTACILDDYKRQCGIVTLFQAA